MRADTLMIRLDPEASLPLYRQIRNGIAEAILAERLPAGMRLPSIRQLAQTLCVSRNTLTLAFDLLVSEGYVVARRTSGYFVSQDIRPGIDRAPPSIAPSGEAEAPPTVRLSVLGRALAATATESVLPRTRVLPFRPAAPPLADFPIATWRTLANRVTRQMEADRSRHLLWEGEAAGYRPLREAIATYVAATRGVRCQPGQVVVVSGSQQALALAAMILLERGDEVWMEDPAYLGARAALGVLGARLVPVPVDEDGLDIVHGCRIAPGARLAYVTPSRQFPLGVTMSVGRRLQLLQWARESGAWIIEDDYDAEFRFGGRPLSSLQGLDDSGRVIYVGTFSKSIFPALRLGYVVVPPGLAGAFATAKAVIDRHCPVIEQAVLAEFLTSGLLARHIRRMRGLCVQRQRRLQEVLEVEVGELLRLDPVDGGFHAVAWLTAHRCDRTVAEHGRQAGLDLVPLSRFAIERNLPPALVLGFAPFDVREIEAAGARLGRTLRETPGPTASLRPPS
ncbi:PLP-dependent aminotransferase family protein (plasmid) [Geminicoccaceae bacterium 1502E]|nr:PLP-dependent aminotransferase family protein [Geminicoccaceae bacterium 1502E]